MTIKMAIPRRESSEVSRSVVVAGIDMCFLRFFLRANCISASVLSFNAAFVAAFFVMPEPVRPCLERSETIIGRDDRSCRHAASSAELCRGLVSQRRPECCNDDALLLTPAAGRFHCSRNAFRRYAMHMATLDDLG